MTFSLSAKGKAGALLATVQDSDVPVGIKSFVADSVAAIGSKADADREISVSVSGNHGDDSAGASINVTLCAVEAQATEQSETKAE